jgi:hypothetical protein
MTPLRRQIAETRRRQRGRDSTGIAASAFTLRL